MIRSAHLNWIMLLFARGRDQSRKAISQSSGQSFHRRTLSRIVARQDQGNTQFSRLKKCMKPCFAGQYCPAPCAKGIAQELGGQAFFEKRELGEIAGEGDGDIELVGERIGEVAARDHAEAQEDHPEPFVRFALLELQRPVQVGGVELAALDEDFTEALGQGGAFQI